MRVEFAQQTSLALQSSVPLLVMLLLLVRFFQQTPMAPDPQVRAERPSREVLIERQDGTASAGNRPRCVTQAVGYCFVTRCDRGSKGRCVVSKMRCNRQRFNESCKMAAQVGEIIAGDVPNCG